METSTVKVKTERPDESEINLMAAEMLEKNKQKMLSQAPQIAQQNQMSQQVMCLFSYLLWWTTRYPVYVEFIDYSVQT